AIWALHLLKASWFSAIGERFVGDIRAIDGVLLIPPAALYFAWERSRGILFPSESLRSTLKHWEGFQMLFDRIVYSLILISFCAISCLFLRIFSNLMTNDIKGVSLVSAVLLALALVPNLAYA